MRLFTTPAIFFACLLFSLSILGQCPNNLNSDATITCTRTYDGDHIIDRVFFNPVTITIDGDVTIDGNLTIEGELIVNGTVTVTGSLNISDVGILTIEEGAVVNVGGDVNNTGTWFLIDLPTNAEVAGTMNVGGDFNNNDNGVLTVGDGGVVNVEGDFNSEEGSTATVEDGGTLNSDSVNDNGGDITVDGTDSDCLDDGCCGAQCGVLPVELISWTHKINARNQCELSWKTASEINNKGFYIEKKDDPSEEFTAIAFVEGNGSTSQPFTYHYTDVSFSGNTYYRLKQVDFDGAYEYFDIIYVPYPYTTERKTFSMYPNPFRDEVTFLMPEDRYELMIYDLRGQLRFRVRTANTRELEDSFNRFSQNLQAGVYQLILYGERHQFSTRFIKE